MLWPVSTADAAIAVAVALGGAAVAAAARLALRRARAPRLPPPLANPQRVAVLVPARNEADNIGECLATLLRQSAPVNVLVLDDGSTDRTRERARMAAPDDPRVRVLAVPPPPALTSGKVNTLAHGLARLDEMEPPPADWVLALDADARPVPDAVARALAAAEANGLSAISLAASQDAETVGEALLTPLVFAMLDRSVGDWGAVALGDGPPLANGQFFLFRRQALAEVGGFAALGGEYLDDIAMAQRLAASGFRVGFWRAGDALRVRMYVGFTESFRGWRRNLALLYGARRGAAAAAMVCLLAPFAGAAGLIASGAIAAGIVAWAGGTVASVVVRAGTGSAPAYGLLYPFDAFALAACLLAAIRDRTRGRLAAWRGRQIGPGARTPENSTCDIE